MPNTVLPSDVSLTPQSRVSVWTMPRPRPLRAIGAGLTMLGTVASSAVGDRDDDRLLVEDELNVDVAVRARPSMTQRVADQLTQHRQGIGQDVGADRPRAEGLRDENRRAFGTDVR